MWQKLHLTYQRTWWSHCHHTGNLASDEKDDPSTRAWSISEAFFFFYKTINGLGHTRYYNDNFPSSSWRPCHILTLFRQQWFKQIWKQHDSTNWHLSIHHPLAKSVPKPRLSLWLAEMWPLRFISIQKFSITRHTGQSSWPHSLTRNQTDLKQWSLEPNTSTLQM